MNRIDTTLANLKSQNKKALVPYLPVGFPSLEQTDDLLHTLCESGADLIELGVPFSDPMADGPVIQRATEQAMANGASLRFALSCAAKFRERNQATPLVLMTYANPIEAMGFAQFVIQAKQAGIDGVLLVDVPLEELGRSEQSNAGDSVEKSFHTLLGEQNLHSIHFIAPTTQDGRVQALADKAKGFIYYVALKGVTGAATLDANAVAKQVQRIRQQLDLPVLVGFGIRDGASAGAVGRVADGVIVGTELVARMQACQSEGPAKVLEQVRILMTELRTALD